MMIKIYDIWRLAFGAVLCEHDAQAENCRRTLYEKSGSGRHGRVYWDDIDLCKAFANRTDEFPVQEIRVK